MSDNGEDNTKEKKAKLAMKIQGRGRAIRTLSDQMVLCPVPSTKAAIYSQMERIRDLLVESVGEDWWGELDIDLSDFARAYSDLISSISTVGSSLSVAERKEIKDTLRNFLRAITFIEFTLRGAKLEEWYAEEEAEGNMSADELVEFLT